MKNFIFCRCGKKCASCGPLVLRVVTGLIFAVHGFQKFSGGIEGVGGFFGSLGIPAPLFFAYVVTFVELVGGIALILGFLTHWAAKLLAIDMAFAFFLVHASNGFYVNKGGYEFVLILFAAAVTLMIMGSGSLALDNLMMRKKEGEMKDASSQMR